VNVKEVLVPVIVTDTKGHHVSGLKQSDFHVSEDGVPQEIVAFRTAADSASPGTAPGTGQAGGGSTGSPTGASPAPAPASKSVRHTYLICIDTLHSSFASFGRVRSALLKSLRQEQGTDTQYALMALGRDLTVVQDFTTDLAAIEAAIGSKEFTKTIQSSEATGTAVAVQQLTALMRDYCSACACESNRGGDRPGCPGVKDSVKGFLFGFEERIYILNHDFLLRLNELVKATAGMPASRSIIFISDGFNSSPGREMYGVVLGFAPRDHSFSFASRDIEPELQNILKSATRDDVRFYTLDSRGVYSTASNAEATDDVSTSVPTRSNRGNPQSVVPPTTESVNLEAASVARENNAAMARLAQETGGLFFQNSNDLPKGIATALTDTRRYYVLAYVPKNGASDGKYRRIKVEVNGADKFRVNAKAGYWANEK
jgi:VWFA-related protein